MPGLAPKKPPPDRRPEPPPKRKRFWWRFTLASVLIVAVSAAATATSILLYLDSIAHALCHNNVYSSKLHRYLANVDGGEPENILILGSDKRANLKEDPGRSDTTILLRLDPDHNAIAVMSIPRDLKVEIPGYGTDKFNAAYTLRRAEADAAGGQGTDRPADQPRRQRRLPRLRPGRRRDRLRLHRRRPPLLPLQRRRAALEAVLRNQHPARLPAALRQESAATTSATATPTPTSSAPPPAGLHQRRPPAGLDQGPGLRPDAG